MDGDFNIVSDVVIVSDKVTAFAALVDTASLRVIDSDRVTAFAALVDTASLMDSDSDSEMDSEFVS